MTDKTENNPFAPPRSRVIPQQPPATVSRVEGNCIVVKSGVRLPMRCVATNIQCNSSDQKKRTLRFAPSFRLVISRKNCLVYRCVSAKRRKREFIIRAFIFMAAWSVALALSNFVIVACGIAFAISYAAQLDPLKVVKYKNGEFWIRGLHGDFLNSLVAEEGWQRV